MSTQVDFTSGELSFSFVTAISELRSEQWNALVPSAYPFLRWEFLFALENSECVCNKTGWQPQHMLVKGEDELLAIMPLYLKNHSRGEYVFDYAWADAYQRNDLEYYPKFLSAIPFTPCEGPRVCFSAELSLTQKKGVFQAILRCLADLANEHNISSWHCLFPEADTLKHFEHEDVLIREGVQFQWFNHEYENFDDYLAVFTSKQRKNLKRERRRIEEQGIEIKQLRGSEITQEHWQAFFKFYQATYWKRGMPEYLNLDFFLHLSRLMPEQLLLVIAEKNQEILAGALSIVGSHTLYGRYWGCVEEYNNLHFELCYYQGIEFCIEKGITCFNSGAQGEHKISRGFEPVKTYSLHWIAHPGFAEAIARFIDDENAYNHRYKDAADQHLPFNAHSLQTRQIK